MQCIHLIVSHKNKNIITPLRRLKFCSLLLVQFAGPDDQLSHKLFCIYPFGMNEVKAK